MRDLVALKPFFIMAALLAVVLLALWGLVSQGVTQWIVPPPDEVSVQLVRALKAHRYEGAMNQLSEDLQKQVSEEDLRSLVQEIERSQQGVEDAQSQDSQEQGDTASASVKVKLGSQQEQTLEFSLQKENGLWKVSSLDPLQSLR